MNVSELCFPLPQRPSFQRVSCFLRSKQLEYPLLGCPKANLLDNCLKINQTPRLSEKLRIGRTPALLICTLLKEKELVGFERDGRICDLVASFLLPVLAGWLAIFLCYTLASIVFMLCSGLIVTHFLDLVGKRSSFGKTFFLSRQRSV